MGNNSDLIRYVAKVLTYSNLFNLIRFYNKENEKKYTARILIFVKWFTVRIKSKRILSNGGKIVSKACNQNFQNFYPSKNLLENIQKCIY